MIRPVALAFVSLLLIGCGGGDDAGSSNGGSANKTLSWTGRWEGNVDCSKGTESFSLEFNDEGHFLLKAGDKLVAQTKEGQITEWESESDGAVKLELKKLTSKGNTRTYEFEGNSEKQDGDIRITIQSRDGYELELTDSVLKVVYTRSWEEEKVTPSEIGDEISNTSNSKHCEGDLSRK